MDITEDILFNEIFPRITIKEIVILSLTCKSLHQTIASKNFFDPFADRIRRLRKMEQTNQECAVTLDRMYYIHPFKGRPLILICVKFHMSNNCKQLYGGDSCFSNPVIMDRYTNNEWINWTDKRFIYCKNNTFCQIFYPEEIKYFALKIKVNMKEPIVERIETTPEYIFTMGGGIVATLHNHVQWDNNNNWNYYVSRQYHWIPDLVLTKPSRFDNDGQYLPNYWTHEDIPTEKKWRDGPYISFFE